MVAGNKGIDVDTTSGKATVNVNDGGSSLLAVHSTGNAIDVTTTSGGVDINILNDTGVLSDAGNGILVNTQSGNVNINMTAMTNTLFTGQTGVHVNNQTGNTSIIDGFAGGLDSGFWLTSTTGTIVADTDVAIGGQWGVRAESRSGLVKVLVNNKLGFGSSVIEGDQAIFASTGGAGEVIVDLAADTFVGQNFYATTRFGVTTAAVNGETTVTSRGAVSGSEAGILSQSTGTGDITINVLGGSVSSSQEGIAARQTGTGNVNSLSRAATFRATTGRYLRKPIPAISV